jgi:hypothetical protein
MSTYTNRDVLGCCKEPVDQNTHERRIQSILNREISQFGIGHPLGDHDGADGDT